MKVKAINLCFAALCLSVLLLMGYGAAPSAVAQAPSETPTSAPQRLIREKIAAPSLKDNLIGERAEHLLVVYLPPSYYTSDARYPVVYFLPGFQDTGGSYGVQFSSLMDALIKKGTIKEMIVAIADGVNTLGGSFYVNSPVTGNWEDWIVTDVVGYVDAHYRTIADVKSRGLSGHSMGGFGALNLGMLHPDIFSAIFSLSPGLFDENGLANSQMFATEYAIKSFLSLEEKIAAAAPESAMSQMKYTNFDLGFTIAYGAAFAPDPAKGIPFIDYPYREENEKLVRDETIWKTWESGFGGIKAELQKYKANFLKLKALAVDYGTRDEYHWISEGCAYFAQQLDAAGIPNKVTSFPGGHQDQLNSRIEQYMLPFFSENLAFAQ